MPIRAALTIVVAVALLPAASALSADDVAPPASILAEGVPEIPAKLGTELNAFRFRNLARFAGWFAGGRRMLLFKHSDDGTEQVFLQDSPRDPPVQLTVFGRPIVWVYAHPNRQRFIVALDEAGNEKNHLFLHDVVAKESQRFAHGQCRNDYPCWSKSGRLLAFSSDARNGRDMDLYIVNPPVKSTGRLLRKASGICAAQAWSPDDRKIAVVEYPPASDRSEVHVVDVATGEDQLIAVTRAEHATTRAVRWSVDGNTLYWVTDRNSEFVRLAKYDLTKGEETILAPGLPWDVSEFDLSDDGSTIVFVVNEDGRSVLHQFDTRQGREVPAPRFASGSITGLTFRPNSLEFCFQWGNVGAPTGVYSYDLATGQRSEWQKPKRGSPLAGQARDPELIRYRSFDGKLIPAYIRHPARDFKGPRPVLIELHGGPESQSVPAYGEFYDYLTERLGIAVIMPNVRGSTGYGKTYTHLDDGTKREVAIKDVGALMDWVAGQPNLDSSRVAVAGGSYGGFLALSALCEYGDRLKAGIDLAGISDLASHMKTKPDGDIDAVRAEYGDERDPKQLEYLNRISPLTQAAKIHTPLLVVHGVNDPRVDVSQSEQIVDTVRGQGVPVWFIRFEGEGHTYERSEHAVYLVEAEIEFLKRFLLDSSN
jgi:dipeptidyl aminopeptidase/acylaminoacyl peptidase